jgi:hypothetical protein
MRPGGAVMARRVEMSLVAASFGKADEAGYDLFWLVEESYGKFRQLRCKRINKQLNLKHSFKRRSPIIRGIPAKLSLNLLLRKASVSASILFQGGSK